VQKAALVETQSQQQWQQQPIKDPHQKTSIKKPHQKTLVSSFNQSFISSGKQGGRATVLGEGRDIVTGETCVPTSLNINNLGKVAVLYFALRSLLWLGPCQTQPVDYWAQLCLCQVLIGFS
jgi:hypothetical protein